MKIIFAGGGSADDSLPLDKIFAKWLGCDGNMLYLPIALRGIRTFESCLEWIKSTFAPLEITDITMWTSLTEHQASELNQFSGVYIGGGNTFALLAELQESGFDKYLKAHAKRGGPIYGGSAGAVILGRDIQIVAHVDSNNVGLKRTTGLDLAHGHAIWPHYTPADDNSIRSYIEEHNFPVLALSERAGIIVENDQLYGVGFEAAFRFDGDEKITVHHRWL